MNSEGFFGRWLVTTEALSETSCSHNVF